MQNTTNHIQNNNYNQSLKLDPKSDLVFKKIFGNELHSNILISLLNSIIFPYNQANPELITKVELLNTYMYGDHVNEKVSVLDIRARTNCEQMINIEMQIKKDYDIIGRSLYYGSRLINSQLAKKELYGELKRSVVIFILDFIVFPEEINFHNVYLLKNIATNSVLTDLLKFHYIELPK